MSALSARTPAISETSVTVGDVVGVLEAAYPLAWAEDWDRAGLVLGEREAPVSRLLQDCQSSTHPHSSQESPYRMLSLLSALP